MINRKKIINEYKAAIQPMGIIQIKNLKNNRVYITTSMNIPGTINSLKFQLNTGHFPPSPSLANDWKALSELSFSIEVLDELKPVEIPNYNYEEDLNTLKNIWIENNKFPNMY